MKTGEQVLRHIDELYERWLERPHMYSSSPRLEEMVATLERLRNFIITEGEGRIAGGTYGAYLLAKGFGARLFTFTSNLNFNPGTMEERTDAYRDLCGFLRSYLAASRNDPRWERT